MRSMRPDPAIRVRRLRIPTAQGSIPALVLSPKAAPEDAPGLLWLHGGGYVAGMKEMVHMSRAVELVKRFGAVVLSPGYRLALQAPYPAAMDDCYAALLYLRSHAAALGVRSDQLMVGGESAGGGLCAAVCIRARDEGTVNVAFQMPLYPMLDDRDTETSRDNHGRGWNTRRNHLAWRLYLRGPAALCRARAADGLFRPAARLFVRRRRRAVLRRDCSLFRAAARRGHPGGDGHLSYRPARVRHDAAEDRAEPTGSCGL